MSVLRCVVTPPQLFDKWVPRLLEVRKREVKELVPITEFNGIISLCAMFKVSACLLRRSPVAVDVDVNADVDVRQNLATPANGCSRSADPEGYASAMERWFAFSAIWTIGAAADEGSRRKFNGMLE